MSHVSVLERSQRAQGQTLADTCGHVSQIKHDVDITVADIGEFMTCVMSRLASTETVAQRKFDDTDASINAAQTNFTEADACFTRLEDAFKCTMTSLGVLQTLTTRHDLYGSACRHR